MFTKLTETSKAAIYSVLVLLLAVGAALLIRLLNLSPNLGMWVLWSITPSAALPEALDGQRVAGLHRALGAQRGVGRSGVLHGEPLSGVGEHVFGGRLRDTDPCWSGDGGDMGWAQTHGQRSG